MLCRMWVMGVNLVNINLNLRVSNETKDELVRRSDINGCSINSLVLIHLLMYDKEPLISPEEVKRFKKVSPALTSKIRLNTSEEGIERYVAQQRYELTVSQYISWILEDAVVELTDLYDVEKVDAKAAASTFYLSTHITAKMREMTKVTKITLTGIGNLAVLLDRRNESIIKETSQPYLITSKEKIKKVSTNLRLSPFTRFLLSEKSKNRSSSMSLEMEKMLNNLWKKVVI